MNSNQRPLYAVWLALLLAIAAAGQAARAQPPLPSKATINALADRTSYAGGDAVRIAVAVEVEPGWHVNSHTPTYDYLIPTELNIEAPAAWSGTQIDYPAGEMQQFSFADDPLSVYDGQFFIYATLTVPRGIEASEIALPVRLRYQSCDDRRCLPPTEAETRLTLRLGQPGDAANAEYFDRAERRVSTEVAHVPSPAALPLLLLFAWLGGLILNAMPCVLPVLSLKVFGLMQSRDQGRSHVIWGSLATAAGILVSFWALAAAAILARWAGATVGWGVQFQQPGFVVFLAVVVVLFCLNLWGVFEIPLPARLAAAGGGNGGGGAPSHFTTGLFATLMATPCSAPFLGTAVGFALGQPAGTIVAIFTAVGVGMAMPYFALAMFPGAIKILPKPGPWMDTLRKSMGFLLAAAAVWLLYVLSSQVSPERLAFIELALVTLALLVWLTHRSGASKLLRRLLTAAVVAAAIGTIALAKPDANAAAANGAITQQLISWVPFDQAAAESLVAEGRLVFVDVTADWCITCKFNEQRVLETRETAALFEQYEVAAMKADWTNRDERIAAFLARFGKSSVPFYVLYSPGKEPHVFSELLTRKAVRRALEATETSS